MKTTGPAQDPAAALCACARCSLIFETCCVCRPGEEDVFAPVSPEEGERIIMAAPPGAAAGLLVRAPNSGAFVQHMLRLFPGRAQEVARLYPQGGTHGRLATASGNRCALLGERGCRLPRESRPYFCRLYPFWFNGSDQPCLFSSDRCLALREQATLTALCAALDTSLEQLADLYRDLCRAWGFAP